MRTWILWLGVALAAGCGGDDDGGAGGDGGPSPGQCDGVASGGLALAWSRVAGGAGLAVAASPGGGAFVTGQFSIEETFGAGDPNETTLEAPLGITEAFVSSHDGDGKLAWASQAGGTGGDSGAAAAVTADGGVVVTGTFSGTATFGAGDDQVSIVAGGDAALFLARYEEDGSLAWVRRVGGAAGDGRAAGTAVAVAEDGSIRVLGSFLGPATFGEGEPGERMLTSMASNAGLDGFVAAYADDGTFSWVTRSIGPYFGAGQGFSIASDGGTLVGGTLYDAVIFRPGEPDEVTVDGGVGDVLVVKYDADGDVAWTVRSSGDVSQYNAADGVVEAPDGGVFVAGAFDGTVVFGADASDQVTVTSVSSLDLFVARYDAAGSLVWLRTAAGSRDDDGVAIGIASDGSISVAAELGGETFFELGTPMETTVEADGAVLTRWSEDGALLAVEEVGDANSSVVATSLGVLPTGSLRLVGRFAGAATFGVGDPAETTLPDTPGGSFVARYDVCP